MSDGTGSVLQRIIAEHRRVVYALVAGIVINLAVFAFLVYPLRRDVANVEQRTKTAEDEHAAAQADFARANGTLTGKDRAVKELDTFYSRVIARDLTGARRLTFTRLAEIATDTGLDFERRKYEPIIERGSNLTRLQIDMDLTGSYADIRNFIHEIESSPEFVVIDNVGLTEGSGIDALRLTLRLSTYFRTEP